MSSLSKISKVIFFVVGFIFVGLIGRCFYMVACISCTTPSLKMYSYSGTEHHFENSLKNLAKKNSNIVFKIVPRGPGDYDAKDLIVKIYKNDSLSLEYNMVIYFDDNRDTKISLESIQDGAYKINGDTKDSDKKEAFFKRFEKGFLPQLKNNDIDLKADFFNF